MANYYIADLELGHENAIRFDNRPFSTIEAMDREIIHRWNSRITAQDTVYIVGNFCWKPSNYWIPILQQLSGRKVLIRGNHDPERIDGKLRKLFDDVKDYKEITDNGRKVCLCYYPMMFYNHSHSPNSYMLCGYMHNATENEWFKKWCTELREQRILDGVGSYGQIINVGCTMPYMDYTPRTLDELIRGVGWRI